MKKETQEKERDKKAENIIAEMQKRFREEGGEGGYFTKLWKNLDSSLANNLKSFKFKKEVLNAYGEELPTQFRFIIERGVTGYIRDKEGIWGLKFFENNGFVWASLIDLTELSKIHQEWWYDHLIENDKTE